MKGRLPRTLVAFALLVVAGCVSDPAPASTLDPAAEPGPVPTSPAATPEPSPEGVVGADATTANATAAAIAPEYEVVVEPTRLRVEAPVPVVLVGFPPGAEDALARELDAAEIVHRTLHAGLEFPPDPLGSSSGLRDHPLALVPRYEVAALPSAAAGTFFARLQAEGVVSKGLYDGNLAEDLLVELMAASGMAPRAQAPALVLVDATGRLPDGHRYAYEYPGGTLSKVRVFGERHPVLVADVSAAADPWVGTSNPYEEPQDPGRTEGLAQVARLVRDATEHRLLQGPLYPPSARACHGVTVLAVTQATSVAATPLFTSSADAVEMDRLQEAFQRLVGDAPVTFDLRVVRLPVDDPALQAVATTGDPGAIRWHLTENWASYWVPHEGCEAYLSVLLDASVLDGTWGVALYDVDADRRISFSVIDDEMRLCEDVFGCRDATPGRFGWPTHLVAHETGHLFGQRHPHDVTREEGSRRAWAFSSVYSAMSYQTQDRTWEFGAVDQSNFQRNRMAVLFDAARAEGLLDDAATLDHVLSAIRTQDWTGASARLLAFLAADA